MDPTEAALLAAILALPDDDLPRLVYADWLDEAGHPDRAEFIRVQCELARGELSVADLMKLRIREKILLERHSKTWMQPLRAKGEALQNSGTHGLFYRGFIEIVWMPAAIFSWKAKKLFTKSPVRELRITRLAGTELHELLTTPEMQRIRTLDLSTHRLGELGLAWLCRSGFLLQLQRLRLRRCFLTAQDVEPLLESEANWPNLVELDLSNNPIPDEAVARLQSRYGSALITGANLRS